MILTNVMLENRNNQKWDGNKAPRSFPRSWKQSLTQSHKRKPCHFSLFRRVNSALLACVMTSTGIIRYHVHFRRVAGAHVVTVKGVERARTLWTMLWFTVEWRKSVKESVQRSTQAFIWQLQHSLANKPWKHFSTSIFLIVLCLNKCFAVVWNTACFSEEIVADCKTPAYVDTLCETRQRCFEFVILHSQSPDSKSICCSSVSVHVTLKKSRKTFLRAVTYLCCTHS